MKKVLIIIPVHNEAKTLETQVGKVINWNKENLKNYDWIFALVDNASTDATKLGKQLEKKFENFRYYRLNQKGRGFALKWAWIKLNFDYCIYMDIDLATDLKHIGEVLKGLETESDLVVGSRWLKDSQVENRNWLRTLMSFGYKTIVQTLTGSKISDFQCGFKGFTSKLIKIIPTLQDNEWFLDTELVLVAQRAEYKVKDIPIYWKDDPVSKVHVIKDSWKMFWKLMKWKLLRG